MTRLALEELSDLYLCSH